jgi:kynurenine formamidase
MERAWLGWHQATPASARRSQSDWLELSLPLSSRLARVPFFPAPRFERIMSMPRDPLNATEMQMVCHFGTHVDAPCHFIPDGPAFHEIPLDRLHGPGVVWRIDSEPGGEIDAAMLARQRPALHEGDILLVDTGSARHLGTERYAAHPSFTPEAARWIVDRGVKLLGIDCLTPDLAVPYRPAGFDWPVHHILLSRGVLIAENLTNLRALAGLHIEAWFLALNIEGADGAPARVIARRSPIRLQAERAG